MRSPDRFHGGRFGMARGRSAEIWRPGADTPPIGSEGALALLKEKLKLSTGAKARVGDEDVDSGDLFANDRFAVIVGAYHAQPPTDAASYNNYGCALAMLSRATRALDALASSIALATQAQDDATQKIAEANEQLLKQQRSMLRDPDTDDD